MSSIAERNAAFDAAKGQIEALIPAMFRGYVHDDVILRVVDAALNAAERARNAAPVATPPPSKPRSG